MQNICWLLVGMNLPGKESKMLTQSSVFEGGQSRRNQELALRGTLGFTICIAFFVSLLCHILLCFSGGYQKGLDLYC